MSRSHGRGSKREKRASRKEKRNAKRNQSNGQLIEDTVTLLKHRPQRAKKPLQARTETQGHYILSIEQNDLTFGLGPAGTGKTYVCGAMAAEALDNGDAEKIIITRPVVEAGENLGFLPGEVEDKFAPYLQPFRDVLNERLGKGHVDYLIKAGRIEAAPLAYMRGRTFKDCWVVLDEAQNTTPTQMKLFLTRIGENSRVIVNGDINQKDIVGASGLTDAVQRLSHLRKVDTVEFSREDIVRSGLVQQIVEAYE